MERASIFRTEGAGVLDNNGVASEAGWSGNEKHSLPLSPATEGYIYLAGPQRGHLGGLPP